MQSAAAKFGKGAVQGAAQGAVQSVLCKVLWSFVFSVLCKVYSFGFEFRDRTLASHIRAKTCTFFVQKTFFCRPSSPNANIPLPVH